MFHSQRQGAGIVIAKNGTEYIGEWNGDKMEGKGKVLSTEHCISFLLMIAPLDQVCR